MDDFSTDDVFSSLFLCKNGAHVNVSTPETGDTPLHMAAKYESLRVVAEKLLELGADTNAQNDNNWYDGKVYPFHMEFQDLKPLNSKLK